MPPLSYVLVVQDTGDQELSGGNASASVIRVGDTVRKPWLPTTDRAIAYLRALRDNGIDVPEHFGVDEHGRQVLQYVPGQLAMDRAPLDLECVAAVGRLVRSIHDASSGLPVPDDWPVLLPADAPALICHHDLATWNLVIDGDRLVSTDWDGSGPSTRLWDLAYAAISFGHLFAGSRVRDCMGRLRALLEGYDAAPAIRAALPHELGRRAAAMHDLLLRSSQLGIEPWASMHAAAHGEHWRAATDCIVAHQARWVQACRAQ